MNKTLRKVAIGLAMVALVSTAQATLTVNYTVGANSLNLTPSADTATFVNYSDYSGTLILASGVAQQSLLNTVNFSIGDSGQLTGTFFNNAPRDLTVNGFGPQTISQPVQDDVTTGPDVISILDGSTTTYYLPEGTLQVTPLAADPFTGNFVGATGTADVYGTFLFTAVPEPTTIIAGALLLLPLGASTLRILRKNRVA